MPFRKTAACSSVQRSRHLCVAGERLLVRHRILATHSSKKEAGSKLVAILLPTLFIKRKHFSGEHILVREHILERYHFVAYACPQGLDLADPLSRCQKSSKVSDQAHLLPKGTTKIGKNTFESVFLTRLRRSRAKWNCWRLSPQCSKVSTQAREKKEKQLLAPVSAIFKKYLHSACVEQKY